MGWEINHIRTELCCSELLILDAITMLFILVTWAIYVCEDHLNREERREEITKISRQSMECDVQGPMPYLQICEHRIIPSVCEYRVPQHAL